MLYLPSLVCPHTLNTTLSSSIVHNRTQNRNTPTDTTFGWPFHTYTTRLHYLYPGYILISWVLFLFLFLFLFMFAIICLHLCLFSLYIIRLFPFPTLFIICLFCNNCLFHTFFTASVCVCMRGVYVIQLGFPFFVKICLHLSFVSEFHSTAADLLTLACVHFCVSFQFAVWKIR